MIIDADPDVLIIVEASWDSAINKIDYMHNSSAWCNAPFVQKADYIKIPFSASALGPRNGAAALDLVSAAIHVTTGDTMMNFQSGVEFFDPSAPVPPTHLPAPPRAAHASPPHRPPPPRLDHVLLTLSICFRATDVLVSRTANLLCPLALPDMSYSGVFNSPPPPSPAAPLALPNASDDDDLPAWGIAVIVVVAVLFLMVLAFAIMMYLAEKRGKPIFTTLQDIQVQTKDVQMAAKVDSNAPQV